MFPRTLELWCTGPARLMLCRWAGSASKYPARTMSPSCVLELACLAFLTTFVPAVAAQDSVGALDLDASRLRPGLDSLAIFVVRGADTLRTGTVWDNLEVVGTGETAQLLRVYRSRDEVLGSRVDTIVDTYPSLSPMRHYRRSTRSAEFLDYSPNDVSGWLRLSNGDSVPVQVSLPAPAYGAASFDLLLRAAPLSENWRAEVPAFMPSTRTVVSLGARVVGSESIRGEVCWRVDADFAGTAVTFWIGRVSRRLCQQVMHLQPGVQLLFGAFPGPQSQPARAA